MPETMSRERRLLLRAYGAEVVLTPGPEGMRGAIRKAEELAAADPRYFIPQQFENPANPEIHRSATASEILRDFSDGIDFLITGVGTGGHITGVSERLKERFPNLRTFAVEPAKSAVISGGEPSPHLLQGIGAGFVPANLHTETLDGVIQVSEEDAYEFTVRCAREEGILVGPSSGAALAAVAQKLTDIPDSSTVLTFCYDTGERYFSVDGLFAADGTSVRVAARP
jgi:cysteine synthase A